MIKRIVLAGVALLVLAGGIAGIKYLQIRKMIEHGSKVTPPPETVTTARVQADRWEARLTAVGTLEAVRGVTVAAELPGKVVAIAFESGGRVREGEVLARQDTSSEEAQLAGAEAEATLAKANLDRAESLLAKSVIAPSDRDTAVANHKQAVARVQDIRATIAKKTIRAPFTGRLGIRQIHLGQILSGGEAVVSLQALDPILVNFRLPQRDLGKVREGLTVRLTADALAGRTVEGKITAIEPEVDAATRNVRVQATVPNPEEHLHPGMFADVAVILPSEDRVLAIPTTAVLYAPYSDSVFVVETNGGEGAASGQVVRQQVVRLGEKRGDFVAVTSGLAEGDTVVSTGAFKLRNGQAVVVDNALSPEFELSPQPKED